MNMTKPDHPRHRPLPNREEDLCPADYLGWVQGSHVWWIIDRIQRRHGVVNLCARQGVEHVAPWVEVVWDDGGVIGAVPTMMTDLCMRGGWQVLSPSPLPRNGDAT